MTEGDAAPEPADAGRAGSQALGKARGAFDDGKADGALRTIGEVARAFDIRQHVLRYWEQQFAMLRPLKRSGGRRYYRPADVALIERIDSLINRQGYTLKGARQLLEADNAEVAAPVLAAPSADSPPDAEALLPRLRAIRARLANALEAA